MKDIIFQNGNRKLVAFFTSIIIYLVLMLVVIIFLKPQNLSLETFAISLATGIMVISYGFYASNAYVHSKGNDKEIS
ncbi:MAG: hypothetical protein Q8903_00340 [Bacteroidota bacterium]|nr:hypothetical protein [Bacteroidota bacterium]